MNGEKDSMTTVDMFAVRILGEIQKRDELQRPRISHEDLERNKRFTQNFLKLVLSYEQHSRKRVSARKPTEVAGKSK